MARSLDVYLHKSLVGYLIQDDGGQLIFDYEKNWKEDPSAIPLSQSLPLKNERFTSKECKGFFAGILPEEGKRKTIALNLGISPKNDFSMLDRIGGECAGAVTFIPSGQPLPENHYRYEALNDEELFEILRELPKHPLMAGERDIRLSLAGAQEKIAVYFSGNLISGSKLSLPLGGAPSTHILKPANEVFEGLVFNEAVCMRLAQGVGLPTANVEIRTVGDIDFLLVERYDRQLEPLGISPWTGGLFGSPMISYGTRRLHQEDFCQALGVSPEKKYQAEGGPSLKQCFDLLRRVSSVPAVDLQNLLDGVFFNLLIGNNDAHSKNFSLVYYENATLLTGGKATRLAPLYDLVSTVYYPELSNKMAMKIGGETFAENILPKHFEKLAEETGLSAKIVVQRFRELIGKVEIETENIAIEQKTAQEILSQIKKRCELFRIRFK